MTKASSPADLLSAKSFVYAAECDCRLLLVQIGLVAHVESLETGLSSDVPVADTIHLVDQASSVELDSQCD